MSIPQRDVRVSTSTDQREHPRVVVIGGGIAGLSAAWYLQQEAAQRSLPLTCTVLERSERWGGKILSERIEGYGAVPFTLEAGPDAFLTRKPWALALARELGLEGHFLFVRQENGRTFVLHRGKPVPLPNGLQLLAPTRLMPFLRSPLFSLRGKARIGLELVIPPRRNRDDESLAAFVRRRFGAEALDRVADPLMAGVYNATSERQSLLATFPQFATLEQDHGSIIRGLRATSHKQAPEDLPPFVSFEAGTQTLVEALVTLLNADLRLRAAATRIEQSGSGTYDVVLEDGARLHADAVIVASPASSAATILSEVAPAAAQLLGGIQYAGIGTMYLGYRRGDVPHPLDGFGVVIPSSERRHIDGMTWTSSKWHLRAPADYVLLRVFFGGPSTRDMLRLDDEQLLPILRRELASILDVHAPPQFHRTFRWHDGYPQYEVGHLERVAAIESALPHGVYLAGSSYRGVGVPDCVRQGQSAARMAIGMLAMVPRT